MANTKCRLLIGTNEQSSHLQLSFILAGEAGKKHLNKHTSNFMHSIGATTTTTKIKYRLVRKGDLLLGDF